MFEYHKQLRSFHAVALQRGFSRAAGYLNVGQPTVSEQVRDLEHQFGVELFIRQGKTVSLTHAGEQLFAVTKGMFGHEEEAVQLLRNLQSHQTGMLRIGSVSPPLGISLFSAMEHIFPKVKIELSLSNEHRTRERLLDFKLDVGIVADTQDDPRLHFAHYESHRIVAIVHRSHPLAGRAFARLSDLIDEHLILRESTSETRRIFEACAEANGLRFSPKLEINSREAIFHAVRSGLGVSVVTEVELLGMEDVCPVRLEDETLRIHYYLCCLASRLDRPFITEILKTCGTSAPGG